MSSLVGELLARYNSDRTRLIDMLWDIQRHYGYLPKDALAALAVGLSTTHDDVIETASFYHMFHLKPAGRHRIYLADTAVGRMNGFNAVRDALVRETGAPLGEVDPSGLFGLFQTPCIGLSDQEPAMLVDEVVFTRLNSQRVADIINAIRAGRSPAEVANPQRLPSDQVGYIDALVHSTIHTAGPVFFTDHADVAEVIRQAVAESPAALSQQVVESDLRGRGGAGFNAGLKWQLCAAAAGRRKHVLCNADEGEPGTFKDRVLLTRQPELVIAGMILSAYAIGASDGIIYLRGEYVYLRDYLTARLQDFRRQGLLGNDIAGRAGFSFDIRLQMGAGAYICGEESALIESCEGKRGTPRLKPPFPAEAGYLGEPTCISNVESFAAITRIVEKGPAWYKAMGTEQSSGTRLLSVAGDCDKPGIYEIEWGKSLAEVLTSVGATDAVAVQVGGPSGECVSVANSAQRKIAFEDLSCNGAFTVFDGSRDLLDIVRQHMGFFVAESCGICVPCRVGNTELLHGIEQIINGRATEHDLDQLRSWSELVSKTSRCGLGATSPKPILTTLREFPQLYAKRLIADDRHGLLPSFDADAAVAGYSELIHELEGGQR